MTDGGMRPKRAWIAYGAAWVPPAVIYALAITLQEEATLPQALVSAIITMGVAALAGVPVWRLSGRLPLRDTNPVYLVSLHLGLAVVYGLFWTVAHAAWLWLVAGAEVAIEVWNAAAAWQIVMGAVLYAVIAGVSYLIRTRRRLREQELAAVRSETAAVQARFRALRAQLNPHFLFNALHSLGALVRHDPAGAETALDRLGELLRYALDHGSEDLVRFRAELHFARNYIELETLRFGDRLRVEYDIDDDTLDVLVPPFLLQPLVENAIRHGLAPRAGRGTLAIAASRDAGRLTLTVRDDGRGAAPDALDDADGLGLRVLRTQLETRYGESATLDVRSEPDEGFDIVVSLPARMQEAGLDAVPETDASVGATPEPEASLDNSPEPGAAAGTEAAR